MNKAVDSVSDPMLVLISKWGLCLFTLENPEKIHSILGGINMIIISQVINLGRSARAMSMCSTQVKIDSFYYPDF